MRTVGTVTTDERTLPYDRAHGGPLQVQATADHATSRRQPVFAGEVLSCAWPRAPASPGRSRARRTAPVEDVLLVGRDKWRVEQCRVPPATRGRPRRGAASRPPDGRDHACAWPPRPPGGWSSSRANALLDGLDPDPDPRGGQRRAWTPVGGRGGGREPVREGDAPGRQRRASCSARRGRGATWATCACGPRATGSSDAPSTWS